MIRALALTFLSIVLPLCMMAQTAYKNVRIDRGKGYYAPEEPCYVIHPLNPDIHLVGTNIHNLYRSQNAGKSWKPVTIASEYGIFGDPCLIADGKGQLYFFHLSDPTGKQWASSEVLDRIVCQTSSDQGQTWSSGSFMGLNGSKDQDKEWAIADPASGNIYVTWTQFDSYNSKARGDSTRILFAQSKDQGKSWSNPVRINAQSGNCLDDDQTAEGAVPAVGPNGEIYVAWSFGDRIWFNSSSDGGKTWGPHEIQVAEQPGGWTQSIPGIRRCNGLPVTVCDLSQGPHRGRIYINWTDQRNGATDTDVFVAWSDNGGKTWSEPLRVNNDGPGAHQFFSWMTVDPVTGAVYLVFYDRRNAEGLETEVWMATSTDGGQHFENERISKKPFTPSETLFLGDYNHITAINGMVRPVWTRTDGQKLSVWTALIQK